MNEEEFYKRFTGKTRGGHEVVYIRYAEGAPYPLYYKRKDSDVFCSVTNSGRFVSYKVDSHLDLVVREQGSKIDDDVWILAERSISTLQSAYDLHSDATDGLRLTSDSPLLEPLHCILDTAIEVISKLVGDENEYIFSYCVEWDFGREDPIFDLSNGTEIVVNSIDALRIVIEDNQQYSRDG